MQGDPKQMVADMAVLQPTYLIGSPRVFDRIHLLVMSQVWHGSRSQCLTSCTRDRITPW